MKVLLLGYYGYKNIGDDLFVKSLIDYLSKKCEKVSVLCENDYYSHHYEGAETVEFFVSRDISKLDRLKLIFDHDLIAWGGGTLQLDSKPQNLINIQRVARLLKKKFGFLGIGLEGAKVGSSKATEKLFSNSDFLYFRDEKSYEFGKSLTRSPGNCFLGGDLAFLDLGVYDPFSKEKDKRSIAKLSFTGKYWWGESRAEFYAQPLLQLIERYNTEIHLLPGKVGTTNNDNEFHLRLQSLLPSQNCVLHTWNEPSEFLEILGNMDFHIGNRLHSIILADILGIPNIGINSDPPKIRNYVQKTASLIDARDSEFMEEITLERIEYVFENYQRLNGFLEQESKSAYACLESIFAC